MTTKLILLFTLIAYSIIVSQSFMYLLALKNVQLNLEAGSYIEIRKLINMNMNSHFRYVLYAALALNVLLVIVYAKAPGSLVFITVVIALVALIADIWLTVKGNMPVNKIIDSWTAGNYPANWTDLRTTWFNIFQYRQLANIAGFVSLLMGAVFGTK